LRLKAAAVVLLSAAWVLSVKMSPHHDQQVVLVQKLADDGYNYERQGDYMSYEQDASTFDEDDTAYSSGDYDLAFNDGEDQDENEKEES